MPRDVREIGEIRPRLLSATMLGAGKPEAGGDPTPCLGPRRAQRVKHTDRASSWEDFGSRNPRFAAAGDREAARAAAARYRQFEADYDDALARWTAGDRTAVFPAGTWWMRVHHGARVRPPP